MSAVRRTDRRATRNNISSPYARPSKAGKVQPSKKSLWSLAGLISFLNPFAGENEPEDSDMSSPSDGEIERGSPPCRFSPPQPLPPPPPPPQQQLTSNSSRPSVMNGPNASSSASQPFSMNTSSPGPSGSSLAKNLEPVTRFLVEKAGQPLNDFEAAGIVDYIQKNVQGSPYVPDKPEPFRFSVSPSRGASPNQTQGTGNVQTPRKTLSRNPNGVYRWQGAGSSRPRNRYQSPGFAPRPQQHRIKLSPPKTPLTTDTKRRRVGEEAEPSTPQKPNMPSTSTICFPSSMPESPIPSLPHTTVSSAILPNGKATASSVPPAPVTPKANGLQPRIRTGGLAVKPTAPAIPSPLRQTWKESDSPPQASPMSRPTRAADFMTELIKEVTPTKKPDVSNPYQTACPVRPPAPVRRPVTKRPKSTAKPAEKPRESESEMSAQAIIEATVPKGTKRSRPPAELEQPTREEASDTQLFATIVNGSTHTTRSTINIAETVTIPLDDDESPSKRRKTPPIRPFAQEVEEVNATKPILRPAEIIEPADNTAPINGKPTPPVPATVVSPPSTTKSLFGSSKTSAPKEPSKLRYSFQVDKVEVKTADSAPPAPRPLFFAPPAVPSSSAPKAPPSRAKLSPKAEALEMSVDQLPKYTFSTSSSAGPSFSSPACRAVLTLAVTSLPVYEFTTATAPAHTLNGFNWTAAGIKAPTTSVQTWMCSLCGLQNPANAKDKCTICDAPRQAPTDRSSSPTPTPTPSSSAPSKCFDWSAAGLAPPPKSEDGSWTCSVCSLSNPASATDKCTICDASR